jgi:glycosyltransferase involved in cell wall biosynthesis
MIHVVARSRGSADLFLQNHPFLVTHITVELGTRSYFELLNRLIETAAKSWICLVHDDVYLGQDFVRKLSDLVRTLEADWPNWGLAGNAAMLPMQVGYAATEVVRYLSDPHGGPNLAGQILPAQSIDGNVMLLNLDAMRLKALRLPPFEGFQLYDIVLSLETVKAGLGVLACPQLACWHGSKGNQYDFDRARSSHAFNDYLLSTVRNRALDTINGEQEVRVEDGDLVLRGGIDIQLDSLKAATAGRKKKSIAIVTRTQFTRPLLLKRALDTVKALKSAARETAHFASYVVTDASAALRPDGMELDTSLLCADLDHQGDTRYQLVKFAAENIDADYFWFIDDDDWIFPNEAERLGLVIAGAPRNSIIFLGCQHFSEQAISGDIEDAASFRSTPGRYYSAGNFLASLSGSNHTPFCGQLFPRTTLLSIPPSVYDSVTYYEDYMTTLFALLSTKCFPIVVDKLYVGISVRSSGNTITETDRTKWNRSMSELVSHMVNLPELSQMLSLPVHSLRSDSSIQSLRNQIAERDHRIASLVNSSSWKLTKPLRVLIDLMRGRLR